MCNMDPWEKRQRKRSASVCECLCDGMLESSRVSLTHGVHTHTFAVAVLVKLSLPHRRNSLPMSAELSEHQTTLKVQTVTNKSLPQQCRIQITWERKAKWEVNFSQVLGLKLFRLHIGLKAQTIFIALHAQKILLKLEWDILSYSQYIKLKLVQYLYQWGVHLAGTWTMNHTISGWGPARDLCCNFFLLSTRFLSSLYCQKKYFDSLM